ncbi:MAG: PaaI family thioesterase [Candidatus Binatus sp.]|uniref:PaaI family thioesterase n=1 Tax=Candidatus Binatus sp. TaxID=2811406 RepID=UPI0027169F91|nr:PaaI family thioesterase [Candidatus Binatus sp.]MDO8431801.1 PaaI family thioesterase [Candidatus Binatus sp.]
MTTDERIAIVKALEQAPFSKVLGLKVEHARDGEAIARMPADASLLNPGGPQAPIHGGAIATLADFAACAAVWSLPETVTSATISMTINYTGPGVQTDLVARARVRRKGKRIASLTVEVTDARGALIADALITYKIA